MLFRSLYLIGFSALEALDLNLPLILLQHFFFFISNYKNYYSYHNPHIVYQVYLVHAIKYGKGKKKIEVDSGKDRF